MIKHALFNPRDQMNKHTLMTFKFTFVTESQNQLFTWENYAHLLLGSQFSHSTRKSPLTAFYNFKRERYTSYLFQEKNCQTNFFLSKIMLALTLPVWRWQKLNWNVLPHPSFTTIRLSPLWKTESNFWREEIQFYR